MLKKVFTITWQTVVIFLGILFILGILGLLPEVPEVEEVVVSKDEVTLQKSVEQQKGLVEPPKKKTDFDKIREKAICEIHATWLVSEYSDNEIAADDKYKGEIVLVRGNIETFSDIWGKPYIHLETGDMIIGLLCSMKRGERSKLVTLVKGQDVLIVGRLKGLTGGFLLDMDKCLVALTPED